MKKLLIVVLIIVLVWSVFGVGFGVSKAAGGGLTISPPLLEVDLKPGKAYNETIKINNPTQNLVTVYPVARNFTASGETGTPAIESPSQDATYGLASWVSFSSSKLALTPQQEIEFNYVIKVPTDAEPGGHYASVLFASEPPKPDQNSTQVALESMVGTLILGKVPGAITENAQIKEFSTKKLYFKPTTNFTLRISNMGNVHAKPTGEIIVKDMFGESKNIDVNAQKGNILPQSTRKFENLSWQGSAFSFGRFKATLDLTYGDSQQQSMGAALTFWVIPWWLILLLVILLGLITYFIIRKIKKNRCKANAEIKLEPPRKRIILQ